MSNYYCAIQPTSWALTALISSRVDFEIDRYVSKPSLFTQAKKCGFHTFYFSSAPGFLDDNAIAYKRMFNPDTQFFREEFFEFYDKGVENEWGLSDKTLFDCVQNLYKKSTLKSAFEFKSGARRGTRTHMPCGKGT